MSDKKSRPSVVVGAFLLLAAGLTACADLNQADLNQAEMNRTTLPPPVAPNRADEPRKDYLIGPGDQFQIFVWGNPELSTVMRVRPDGRISAPLIDDLPVSGKTPSEVARTLEEKLSVYVVGVKVAVIMIDFVGPIDRQIKVLGEAAKPQAMSYRTGMTVLDVMIAAGGLTPFAAGNRATISRTVKGQPTTQRVRLADLLKDGDAAANVEVAPGDIVTIPQSWF